MAVDHSQSLRIHIDTSTTETRLGLDGGLTIGSVESLRNDWARTWSQLPADAKVVVDLAKVGRVDGSGVAILLDLIGQQEAEGASVRLEKADSSLEKVLALYTGRMAVEVAARSPEPGGVFHRIGLSAVEGYGAIHSAFDFLGHCAASLPGLVTRHRTVPWRDLPLLLQRVGGGGLSIVILTNLLIGMIVAFVGVLQLQRFGAQRFVTDMVAIGHVRELGPIITAIIISGRTGAGFAAELGTMKVSEEVDALRSLGFDPFRWLVLPRLMTLLVALPLLTLVGDYIGILGGMIASLPILDMTASGYLEATARAITMKHFMLGWIKAIPFAVAITLLSCAQGLATRGGAEAVGERTTRAVVLSIFAVILIDSLHAMIYAILEI